MGIRFDTLLPEIMAKQRHFLLNTGVTGMVGHYFNWGSEC